MITHPSHVFISYSRRDSAFAEQLERDLQGHHLKTWRDTTSITGSQEWYDSIIAGIEGAYAVLLIVTENSEQSRWVKRESLFAEKKGIPIVPILPTAYTPRHFEFLLIETTPFHCIPPNYEATLPKIMTSLEDLRGRRDSLRLDTTDSSAETAYLDFLLSETEADLRSTLYVGLGATTERVMPRLKPSRLGVPHKSEFRRLGLEKIVGDAFEKPGEAVPDARIPLRDMQRCILLGDPGVGKTTTLLQLAIDLAYAAKSGESSLLPVFVPLRSYTGEQSFEAFVQAQMGNLQSHYADLLAEKRLVLLCDALNEMQRLGPDGHSLVADVRDYLKYKPVWVVSCRVRDYQEELADLENVAKVRLSPLDPPQIYEVIQRRFHETPERGNKLWETMQGTPKLLEKWAEFQKYNLTPYFWQTKNDWEVAVKANVADEKRHWGLRYHGFEELWQNLNKDTRRLMSLCRNPYMLYIVCEIFDLSDILPENRGALFAQFVDDLLTREEANSTAVGSDWIPQSQIRLTLAHLAYLMQRSESGTELPYLEAIAYIQEQLPNLDPMLLLKFARAASLIELGDTVRFTHQLLQEYFASEKMAQMMDSSTSPTVFWPSDSWWKPQGWEETAIFLAGNRDLITVAEWIMQANPLLAYRCLRESGQSVSEAAYQSFAPRLAERLFQELTPHIGTKFSFPLQETASIVATLNPPKSIDYAEGLFLYLIEGIKAKQTVPLQETASLIAKLNPAKATEYTEYLYEHVFQSHHQAALDILRRIPLNELWRGLPSRFDPDLPKLFPENRTLKMMMVVDDHIPSRLLLRKVLERAYGEEFVIIEEGDSYTALVSAVVLSPDLVTSDINHPGIGGIEFCKYLHKIPTMEQVLFIFISADGFKEARGLDAGANDFLTKPLNPREVVERIGILLGRPIAY
ncbi:MAG: TIR domain-containing protein [Anaerolineae bacterium]|nr:TIR domain-containing protein [Anaerolineae bacterium]